MPRQSIGTLTTGSIFAKTPSSSDRIFLLLESERCINIILELCTLLGKSLMLIVKALMHLKLSNARKLMVDLNSLGQTIGNN